MLQNRGVHFDGVSVAKPNQYHVNQSRPIRTKENIVKKNQKEPLNKQAF